MSITPAFSPGPWITQGALVGSVRRWILEDLYEQCSFHMAEKMPSSVSEGSRPMSLRMRRYSSGLRPCAATSAGVILLARFVGFTTFLARSLRCAAFLATTFFTAGFFRVFGADGRFLRTFLRALGFNVIGAKCHCRAQRGNPSPRPFHNIITACRRRDGQ